MTPARVSATVRRHTWRPVWYSVLLLAVTLLLWGSARHDGHRQQDVYADGFAVEVHVADSYDGGDLVPVSYVHPLTGRTETEVWLWRADGPEAGSDVGARVDRFDPHDVLLDTDEYPVTSVADLLLGVLLSLIPAATVGLRMFAVRRLRRLASGNGPSFAMLAAISGTWPFGRRARLHLFPLDARPGTAPLCSVPLLVSVGLPAGSAFPVEVKGSPRPLGRVIVRHGNDVLWPRVRGASLTSTVRRPALLAEPPPFPPADGAVAPPATSWIRRAAVAGAAGAGALALLVAVAAVTLVHWSQARRLEQHGVEVVAEVIEADSGGYALGVEYSLPGEDTVREGRAAVDFPEDWDLGDRYPAVVDPDSPELLRLRTVPYDPMEPVIWAALPLAAVLGFAIWLAHRSGRQRRAASGAWVNADARVLGYGTSPTYGRVVELAISRPGAAHPSSVVRVPPHPSLDWPGWIRQPVAVTQMTLVGDPLVLGYAGVVHPCVREARTPRWT